VVGEISDTFRDEDGRRVWALNERIAGHLLRLADYLVIGGYDETHARHYRRLAHVVDTHPESMETLRHEGRLRRLPGAGPHLQATLMELVDTGRSSKWDDWARRVPETVLDLCDIPGVGVKTARMLYLEFGIDSLPALGAAVEQGWLGQIPGIGPKTIGTMRRHLARGG
jgi:DNA polymerase (family 10)